MGVVERRCNLDTNLVQTSALLFNNCAFEPVTFL